MLTYAIVDIETTGGHAEANGITEIAIYLHNGEHITYEWQSLVKPDMPIPPFIERYTGITNQMVKNAPHFEQIAPIVHQLLSQSIFVAHNVNFDYSFIKYQLAQHGFILNTQKLCTVRLSRLLFPGYSSYSLGNICNAKQIPINNRHRAAGDALATVKLFEKLLEADAGSLIENTLKRGTKTYILPPNLPIEEFDVLPKLPGVYYLRNQAGDPIYIGKAKNIKSRFLSHFSSKRESAQKQHFYREVFHVSFTVCPTELIAFILESIEIKKHWPKYNRALKSLDFSFGLFSYEDRAGYLWLAIDRVRKNTMPLRSFKSQQEALFYLNSLMQEHRLCGKYCLVNTSKKPCSAFESLSFCKGACEQKESVKRYNKRVEKAIRSSNENVSFAILDKSTYSNQKSCILVHKGTFWGFGEVPIQMKIRTTQQLKRMLEHYPSNHFIDQVLATTYLQKPDLIQILKD
ncbi:MAG: exonuclease domain-containing protein [Bacteroidia bacterium]|jgi:DNA polymerase-3 subunit epsilon|nr:exonuclease domain-containing protein [Bacteroidia bacterium]